MMECVPDSLNWFALRNDLVKGLLVPTSSDHSLLEKFEIIGYRIFAITRGIRLNLFDG